MAPELFAEGATHSSASDLWSVGCVLYEAAMGRPPFMHHSFNQLVQDILHNEPPPIPSEAQIAGIDGAHFLVQCFAICALPCEPGVMHASIHCLVTMQELHLSAPVAPNPWGGSPLYFTMNLVRGLTH
jgi:serine/threonine protein kinase